MEQSAFDSFETIMRGTVREVRKVIAVMSPLYSQLVSITP